MRVATHRKADLIQRPSIRAVRRYLRAFLRGAAGGACWGEEPTTPADPEIRPAGRKSLNGQTFERFYCPYRNPIWNRWVTAIDFVDENQSCQTMQKGLVFCIWFDIVSGINGGTAS